MKLNVLKENKQDFVQHLLVLLKEVCRTTQEIQFYQELKLGR